MTATIIPFAKRAKKELVKSALRHGRNLPGNKLFVMCPCQFGINTQTGTIPILDWDDEGLHIISLYCPACGGEIPVHNGRPNVIVPGGTPAA